MYLVTRLFAAVLAATSVVGLAVPSNVTVSNGTAIVNVTVRAALAATSTFPALANVSVTTFPIQPRMVVVPGPAASNGTAVTVASSLAITNTTGPVIEPRQIIVPVGVEVPSNTTAPIGLTVVPMGDHASEAMANELLDAGFSLDEIIELETEFTDIDSRYDAFLHKMASMHNIATEPVAPLEFVEVERRDIEAELHRTPAQREAHRKEKEEARAKAAAEKKIANAKKAAQKKIDDEKKAIERARKAEGRRSGWERFKHFCGKLWGFGKKVVGGITKFLGAI